jgi:hypothetical protein
MFRSLLRFLARMCSPRVAVARGPRPDMKVEPLEDRWLPSTISGFVYHDANGNGIFDSQESGIVGSTIQLENASGTVLASTTTDANGFYQFATNPTAPALQQSVTEDVSFDSAKTDSVRTATLPQFNPSLGTLESIDIYNNGTLSSQIQIENQDPTASAVMGTVSGTLALSLPGAPTLNTTLQPVNEQANVGAYDGTVGFDGVSGHDFGVQTASGSATETLTAGTNDLSGFIGTGTVQVTETADATSSASGPGNLLSSVASTSTADVKVVYNYSQPAPLAPGNYEVVQPTVPTGYIRGLESTSNGVIPNSNTSDTIPVTLTNNNSQNNDFGEVKPGQISGFVYEDVKGSGVMDAGDPGISTVNLTLTGVDEFGNSVFQTATTGSDGSYQFTNLTPGTYSVIASQPAGYLPGHDNVGSAGGTLQPPTSIAQIPVADAGNDINYNFGEVRNASLSGYVYEDANNSGQYVPPDQPISGVTVNLTGVDDLGNQVSQTTTTASDGSYSFTQLRPGVYTLTKATTPAGYFDGKDTAGSQGGVVGTDQITQINLDSNVNGINNNFAELLPSSVSGYVYQDLQGNGVRTAADPGVGGVTLTLTGTNDQGAAVSQTLNSNADGSYSFTGLRPGSYTISQGAPPSGFLDGIDSAGSLGGTVSGNQIQVTLGPAQNGTEYDFALVTPPTTPSITPTVTPNPPTTPTTPTPTPTPTVTPAPTPTPVESPLPDISKRLLIGDQWMSW